MSETMSSSVDIYLDDIGDEAINDSDLDSGDVINNTPVIDSRRRLEARLAERSLARDLQEFDFDF